MTGPTPRPHAIACPHCGAPPGRRCHTGDGHHATDTHAARLRAVQENQSVPTADRDSIAAAFAALATERSAIASVRS